MVRQIDVARRAGVSRSTVSNVFNSPEKVRPEVREKVEAAVRELQYAGPDPKARHLLGAKANTIGLVVHDSLAASIELSYSREFACGVAETCDEREVNLLMITAVNKEAAARGVQSALVDGLIIHAPDYMGGGLVDIARARKIPFVAVDFSNVTEAINTVAVDNRAGARAAAEHLLKLGHRRFLIVSIDTPYPTRDAFSVHFHPPHGPRDLSVWPRWPGAVARQAGYREAFGKAGLSLDDMPIVEVIWAPDTDAAARMVLDHLGAATAVLCMADVLAIAIMDEARRRGINVPHDLSIVGYDGIPEAATADPPLTTVSQATREKGRIAAGLVFDPPAAPRQVLVPVNLILRGSTAPPPAEPARKPRKRNDDS